MTNSDIYGSFFLLTLFMLPLKAIPSNAIYPVLVIIVF